MKRQLGKSELMVSPLTLGTFAIGGLMWGGNDKKDSIEAIRESIQHGVTSIDTAPFYGVGLSEEVIGEALKGVDRSKVEILTKFGLVWEQDVKGTFAFDAQIDGKNVPIYKNGRKENVIREVENSLKRLQTDYIDLIQLHWPDVETPISETMEAMEDLMKVGKVRAIGVSNYDRSQLEEGLKTTVLHSDQVPYSMLNRSIEEELLPFAIENQIGIIAYSPLERGLLTGKYSNGTGKLSSDDHRNGYFQQFDPENLNRLLQALNDLSLTKNSSVAQLVLAWTMKQPGITTVLGGARNAEQAIHNAQSLQVQLTDSEWNQIREFIKN